MKKFLQNAALSWLCLLFVNLAFSQTTYYWVGGGGEWGDLSHWANSSGGLGSVFGYPPSPLDDVVFDQNSGFTATSRTVTTPSYSGVTMRNMTWNNAPNNPVFDENEMTDFVVLGNLTLQRNMTFRAQVLMMGNQNAILTSNGCKIGGNLYVDKEGASVTLADSLMLYHVNINHARTGTIVLSNGTLNTNGNTIYANGFVTYGVNPTTFNMANSTMHLRSVLVGAGNYSNRYYNTGGVLTTTFAAFKVQDANKTIDATNTVINIYKSCDGFRIDNNSPYTFNEINYIYHTRQYIDDEWFNYTPISNFGPATIRKITLDTQVPHGIRVAGGIVDTIISTIAHNTNPPTSNGQGKFLQFISSTVNHIEFEVANNNSDYWVYWNYRDFFDDNNSSYSYYGYNERSLINISANNSSINTIIERNANQSQYQSFSHYSWFKNNFEFSNNSNIYHLDVLNTSTLTVNNNCLIQKAKVDHLLKITNFSNSTLDTLVVLKRSESNFNNSIMNKMTFLDTALVTGSSNTVNYLFFDGIGRLSTSSSTYRFAEYNINGWMEGNNNTFDTLVFSPGYTYRFGNGVSNTVRKKWYASGNPCYFTEVYNVGSSGTATINLAAGVPNEFDYIRFWGVKATAASPIYAGVRSINIANNQHITFAPYNALALLYPFGTDQEVRCHSNYPFTLNTDGFYGNTNTTYTWQDGSTLDSFVVTRPGVYTAHAYYGRNCYYSASYTVLDQLTASIDSTSNSNVSCDPNAPTGDLLAVPGGAGTGPYTYSWTKAPFTTGQTPIQTTAMLTDAEAGLYKVEITDATGCTNTAEGNIYGPSQAMVLSSEIYNDCNSSPTIGTGIIRITVQGGVAPYTYSWADNASITAESRNNLEVGSYTVTVTDALGCQSTLLSQVNDGSLNGSGFSANLTVTQPVNCETVGSATLVPPSEITVQSYVWSHIGGLNSATATNIPIGNHTVILVSTSGCADIKTFSIVAADQTAPSFTYCPSNIILTTTGSCGQTATWVAPTNSNVADNCPIASLTSNYSSGSVFPVGITMVTYSARDIFGNVGTCSFNVEVVDIDRPVFANCNADIIIQANLGNCTATATWPTPVVTDNCGVQSVTADFTSGSVFPIGVTTVTYTAVDVNGNSSICTFKVIVKAHPNDFKFNSACPNNETTYSSYYTIVENQCSVPYSIPNQTYTSTCTTPNYVQGSGLYNPGSVVNLPLGSNLITYKLTNVADTITCSYRVNVIDNTGPNYTFNNNMGNGYLYVYPDTCGGYKVNLPDPDWRDNCGIDTTWRDFTNGTVYPPGTHYLRFYARDVNGNTQSVSLYLYVYSYTQATVNGCPSNITVSENTCGGAAVTWTPPTINHRCYDVVASHTPGQIFPLGQTLVTYEYTSEGSQIAYCQFYVTVNPSTSGVTNCPSDITQTVSGNICSKVVTWVEPVFSSPCAVVSTYQSHQSGFEFPLGITTVNYSVTYADNTTLSCSFTVTVRNPAAQPSTVQGCPNNMTVYTNSNVSCTEAAVSFNAPTFLSGTCDATVDHITTTPAGFTPGDNLPVGAHTITYTSYNSSNQPLNTCSFVATVVDTTTRVVIANCTPNVTAYIDPLVSCSEVAVNFTAPTFTSQGCAAPVATVNGSITPGTILSVGNYPVTYTAYDANNIALASCNFNLSVIDTAGTLVVNCPGVPFMGTRIVSVDMDPVTCQGIPTWSTPVVTSSGGCGGTFGYFTQLTGMPSGVPVTLTTDPSNLLVTYGIFDTNDNLMTTCEFYVYRVFDEDVLASSIDTVISVDPATCTALFNWDVPSIQTNCATSTINSYNSTGDWNIHGLSAQNNNGNQMFPIGDYRIQYFVQVGSAVVTVNYRITVQDGGAPNFGTTCPSDTVRLYTSFNQCEAVANWPAPVAIAGTCVTPFPAVLTANFMPGMVLPLGNTTVNYAATYNGLTSNCTFIASVVDSIKPTIYTCPSNITANVGLGCEAVVTWNEPAVFDNCSGVTAIPTYNSGSTFQLGTTTVTYLVSDQSNNTATCSFTVTVVDNEAPVIVNCPSNMTVNSQSGSCGGAATWNSPTAVDNCTTATLVSSFNPGEIIPIGTTTVFYTATDNAGNSSMCSFDITVLDVNAPSLMNCPSDITVNSLHNICAANVVWNAPTSNDPCGNSTITSTHYSGELFTVGTTLVTYYVRDLAGNIDSCSFNVTVTDITAPQITACPPNQELQLQMNQCEAVATWVTPIAIDNCSDVTMMSTYNSGASFPIGTTIVTYLAEDTEGLQDVCTFSITVTDPGLFCGGTPQPGATINVPDAFTPDGDGQNDVLVIEGLQHYPGNELVIFNRWGTEVYRVIGYNNDWDGKMNVSTGLDGSDLPTGTYYYVIDTKDNKVGVLKGFVYLQR